MTTSTNSSPTWLDLYDYRRRVTALYQKRELREATGDNPAAIWDNWREERDLLFKEHPQSAAQRRGPRRLHRPALLSL